MYYLGDVTCGLACHDEVPQNESLARVHDSSDNFVPSLQLILWWAHASHGAIVAAIGRERVSDLQPYSVIS